MSVYAKFKIDSVLAFAKSRFQRFSTGKSSDGRSKEEGTKTVHHPNQKTNFDPYKLFKDKVNQQYFVNDVDAHYMECLFSKWVQSPTSVHKSWQQYFTDVLQSKNVGNIEILPTRQKSTKKPSHKDGCSKKNHRSRKTKEEEEESDDHSEKKRKQRKTTQRKPQHDKRREFDDYGEMMTPFSKPQGGPMFPNTVDRMKTVRHNKESDDYTEVMTPFAKLKGRTLQPEEVNRTNKVRHSEESDDYSKTMTPFSKLKRRAMQPKPEGRMKKNSQSRESKGDEEIMKPSLDPNRRVMKPKPAKKLGQKPREKQDKNPRTTQEPRYQNLFDSIATGKQPQNENYVVGHIILSPSMEDIAGNSNSKQETVKKTLHSDSTSKTTMKKQQMTSSKVETAKTVTPNKKRIDFRKSLEQIKQQKAVRRVRAALKHRPFRAKREFLKSQMERIARMKKSNQPKGHVKPKYRK
ncbi:hypothetical protein AWZ03_000452 [Drosophila navojoa]|uniref:2-oxoglutarate dehydrogenase E1 component N-terminal domain-containing protein n=1 Tax=Drosophila navojoa TaxID=7232 RepID=A0A484BVP8_DRONA|nr:uncharacterized protein LOC108652045 [Drosophila navojoa]TDG52909.1 hypothetical protein AWZ03_000452 [Drosophila navojoa]